MSNLDNKLKYKSSIGFTDLLFNLVIGFVYLFVIAFILINPVAKKGDVIKKAEYMVVIEWNHEYNDDIDLWVKDPAGNVVSFLRKSHGLMHLEKDDLGYSNDVYVKRNKEQIIHLIEITVIKINPYSETYFARVPYIETAQTLSLVRFNIGEDHAYLGHNNNPSDFITKKGVRGTGRYNPYGN